jgi:hypothetical protein
VLWIKTEVGAHSRSIGKMTTLNEWGPYSGLICSTGDMGEDGRNSGTSDECEIGLERKKDFRQTAVGDDGKKWQLKLGGKL